jgi:hypothetical protein
MSRLLSIIGILATLAWLVLIAWIFRSRLGEITQLQPNEVGDFLAGSLGPLGILWLILGYFQQGIELRENTRALDLQATELRNSTQEQRELLRATRAQVDADRAMVALAREQHAQGLLPRFAFLDIATVTSAAGTELRFELRNLGANASEVRFDAKNLLVQPGSTRLPVAMAGLPYACTVTFAPGHPVAGEHLNVAYRDLTGHHGSVRHALAFDGAGKLVDSVTTGA